ncbi:MAG: MXAN_5808 family serine peptidase [Myxococcota bacterium]
MRKYFLLFLILISNTHCLNVVSKTKEKKDLPTAKKEDNLLDLKFSILYVVQKYLDPSRINAEKMLISGLESAAENIPEIMIRKNKSTIEIMADNHKLKLERKVESPYFLIIKFSRVFDFFKKNLPADVDLQKIEHAIITGMLETLDPHTNFLTPEYYKEMKIHHSGAFGGLGIVVSMCSGRLSVIKVLKDTPAYRKKMKPGDKILEIDGESTDNLSLNDAVKRMRGEPATDVRILVKRKNKAPFELTLMRKSISFDSIKTKIIKKNNKKIGYIKVKTFQMPTSKQMKNALRKMLKERVSGIILDLRNNGGGLLSAAINVSNYFMKSGTIVSQVAKHRSKHLRIEKRADAPSTMYNGPLVVLVNEKSASASEIVAGSLKYSNRALIAGNRTFGKGSVQDVIEFPGGGALKITISQYLTYGDASIQGRGIIPDIHVKNVDLRNLSKNREINYYISTLKKYRESFLKSSLQAHHKTKLSKSYFKIWSLIKSSPKKDFICNYCGVDADDLKIYEEIKLSEDSTTRVAAKLLAALQDKKAGRMVMLKKYKNFIKRIKKQEDSRIVDFLAKQRINWKQGLYKENKKLKIDILPTSKTTKAGDWLKVRIRVSNQGKSPVYRLRAVLHSTNPRLDNHEVIFGKLAPSSSLIRKTMVKVPQGVSSRTDTLKVNLWSHLEKIKGSTSTRLKIKGNPDPRINLNYRFIDKIKQDGILEKDEIGKFIVKVKNVGKGATGEARMTLKNLTGHQLDFIKSRAILSNLKPGQSRKVVFKIKAKELTGPKLWDLKLIYNDCIYDNKIEMDWKIHRHFKSRPKMKKLGGKWQKLKLNTTGYDVPWPGQQKNFVELKQGTLVKVLAQMNGYLKVQIPASRQTFAWIKTDTGLKKSTSSMSARSQWRRYRKKVNYPWTYSPPNLVLNTSPVLTREDEVEISGFIKDKDGIRDLYLKLVNAEKKIVGRKIFYRSFNNKRKRTFKIKVKVYDKTNIISLTARDKTKASFSRNLIINKYH